MITTDLECTFPYNYSRSQKKFLNNLFNKNLKYQQVSKTRLRTSDPSVFLFPSFVLIHPATSRPRIQLVYCENIAYRVLISLTITSSCFDFFCQLGDHFPVNQRIHVASQHVQNPPVSNVGFPSDGLSDFLRHHTVSSAQQSRSH